MFHIVMLQPYAKIIQIHSSLIITIINIPIIPYYQYPTMMQMKQTFENVSKFIKKEKLTIIDLT